MMFTCEHCRDRLLDYVYGLLEGSDLQATRAHLQACSECLAALEKVQTQQKLMACAAKAITEVAEFTLPSNDPASAAPTLALTPAAAPKRTGWRRPRLAWAVAAVVLIAVSASFSYYRHTLHNHQQELAQKRREHKQVGEQFTALPAKYKALHNAAIADLRTSAGPYLHVVGPTTLQPGAKAHLHIRSHHPEGTVRQVKDEFVRSNIRIKLVEAQTGKFRVMHLKCDDDGQALAEFDGGNATAGSALKVIVEAETGARLTRIEETLKILAPTYVTRIDTNKIAYQIKDVLFFRVLVLDRFSLQPPSRPIPLHVELLKPDGKPARWADMPTGDGGVLAGEFAIDEEFIDGNYTLNVRPVDPAQASVQAASQRLEVVRELRVPAIQFDKDRYLPGDQLSGIYRGGQPLPNKAMIGKEPVPLTVEPLFAAPMAIPSFGGPGAKAYNDPKKEPSVPDLGGQRFSTMIPHDIPAGASRVPFTVPVQEGKNKKKPEILRTDIPLGPTDFTIDFFPEGGDLIAGLPNRAFYRVRSKSGEPVTGKGQVMLLTGKNDIVDSSYQLGMGYLDFIPNAKETYTVRITTPAKIENVPAPFAKLGIRPEGVVIQVADLGEERVPKAVGGQGDPIRLTVRQQGPARKLLLLAQCRGQIVDQRWVEIKREPVDVILQPTQEAAGMIRVTAYELQVDALQPVAERLVYRGASQRLDLGFTLNTQQLQPGPVSARVTARDEKGQPAPAWLLASVIDERFQSLPRSLSAHFFLLNEIRTGPDLNNAQLILHDSPESTQVLERFLGTHGWRRFIRSDEPALLMQGDAKRAAQPLVFSRENMSQGAMQKQYEDRLAQALTPIRTQGFVEAHELEFERDQAAQAVVLALNNLQDFEERVRGWMGLAPGILLALLLGASLILMGVGTYRIIRARKLATPAFGGSFACLAACLVIIFVGNWIGPLSVTATPSLVRAHGAAGGQVRRDLEALFAQMPAVSNVAEKQLVGVFSARAVERDAQAGDAQKADEMLAKDAVLALRQRSAQAFARREIGDGAFTDRLNENKNFAKGSPAWNLRHGMAKKVDDKGVPPHVPRVQPAPPNADNEKAANKARDRVQYFHQHVPNWQSDTLLWHPTLWLADGKAEVRFDFASGNATYRVLLLGHSPTGRFGFYERRLDVLGR